MSKDTLPAISVEEPNSRLSLLSARSSISISSFLEDLDTSFLRLSLSKNGRKISMANNTKKESKNRKKRKSKHSKRRRKSSVSVVEIDIENETPAEKVTARTNDQKNTVMKRPNIARRGTRGAFPTDKRSRRSLDRLELLFKDAIENNAVTTVDDPKKTKGVPDAAAEDSISWTEAKSTDEVLELIAKGTDAIQASSCGIDAEAMEEICRMLEKTDNVKKLGLAGNKIGDIGALALQEVLNKTSNLFYLHLWGNNLGDVGAETFGEALKDNNTLTYLILSKNGISELGAEAICDGLTYNKSLIFLDLGENCVTDEGAYLFADLIRSANQVLRHLDLSDNGITVPGARSLAKALRFNTAIEELTLAFNEVTEEKKDNQMQTMGWLMFSQNQLDG